MGGTEQQARDGLLLGPGWPDALLCPSCPPEVHGHSCVPHSCAGHWGSHLDSLEATAAQEFKADMGFLPKCDSFLMVCPWARGHPFPSLSSLVCRTVVMTCFPSGVVAKTQPGTTCKVLNAVPGICQRIEFLVSVSCGLDAAAA